jgi:hypothetical protein
MNNKVIVIAATVALFATSGVALAHTPDHARNHSHRSTVVLHHRSDGPVYQAYAFPPEGSRAYDEFYGIHPSWPTGR